jgi:hypothetical protein
VLSDVEVSEFRNEKTHWSFEIYYTDESKLVLLLRDTSNGGGNERNHLNSVTVSLKIDVR